ncbi:radical S-adenosyl methionine domain-containing protein 2-like [Acyrthosiphon pisum]|uniref:S-adenosylmethionine-dependent nucleotide dehydratase RSAD2 n=1 Tax=Acyrthosiphon pisum TaxID=7029 RepID=A0A8R2D5Q2_ACYPI|nr:radical S-adenosyl methionine domain-containing protein 2-like [Acyrthosiphon pisum]|eukprot:XP_016662105.1 PREDICTED: radical S-adenosyl methionine domain-containing protein 2-like [Acyrthosiphon pisum]
MQLLKIMGSAWNVVRRALASVVTALMGTAGLVVAWNTTASVDEPAVPLSVNYHFTRQCNYSCGFCFHTAKTSFVLPLDEAKRGLTILADAGMKKLNFSGGEPFIRGGGRFMGELIKYCKTELRWAGISISIVSNGSLIQEKWMRQYGEHVDMLAVSCDSFNADTNRMIGRQQGARTDHVAKLYQVREWCGQHKIAFKINTVVNTYNVNELFAEHIDRLRPVRWKVFQCLLLEGENAGEGALRNAARFYVTDEEFNGFLRRHAEVQMLVPENNDAMRDSYLILDEYMRFLNCRNGKKEPSASLLDVGVQHALRGSGFDEQAFLERGGVYRWSKQQMSEAELEW